MFGGFAGVLGLGGGEDYELFGISGGGTAASFWNPVIKKKPYLLR